MNVCCRSSAAACPFHELFGLFHACSAANRASSHASFRPCSNRCAYAIVSMPPQEKPSKITRSYSRYTSVSGSLDGEHVVSQKVSQVRCVDERRRMRLSGTLDARIVKYRVVVAIGFDQTLHTVVQIVRLATHHPAGEDDPQVLALAVAVISTTRIRSRSRRSAALLVAVGICMSYRADCFFAAWW